jgi:hypothetical protein
LPVHMPNLLHLVVYFSDLISYIDAPSLHLLQLTHSLLTPSKTALVPNNFARDVATLQITAPVFNLIIHQVAHWNSVKNLIWLGENPSIGIGTMTFQSICSVKFNTDQSTADRFKLTHNLDHFLVALLRYPDACPHLCIFKSSNHPAWGLLTQVLLQRNQNHGVVQLEEIWLPSLPIKSLLSLLVRLLSGSST